MVAPGRLGSKETNSLAPGPAGGGAGGATPMQLMSPPCPLFQLVQSVAALIHSATHSQTFPAVSCAPHTETQTLRAPVSAAKSELVASVACARARLLRPCAFPGEVPEWPKGHAWRACV